jgi:phosphoglycerate dehydrogenase-like enzyme
MGSTVALMNDLPFKGTERERLLAAVRPAEIISVDPGDKAALDQALDRADIAILAGDLDERFLHAPKLRWVHCDHAGLNHSARPEVFHRGLIVTGSAGRSGPALAEHVMMFALLLSARYWIFADAQRRGEWLRTPEMSSLRPLSGRTMGIIGMGHTGIELVRRAKAFNMKVLGYRRRDLMAPPGVDRMYSADRGEGLDELLAKSDILALVVNLSNSTRHLIGARELAQLPAGALVINLARGEVIDQDALVAALASGHLAGAGIDVTTPEPLPAGHPLWSVPNLLITPHFTPVLPDRSARSLDIIVENFRRYRAGEPMLNQLTAADVYSPA